MASAFGLSPRSAGLWFDPVQVRRTSESIQKHWLDVALHAIPTACVAGFSPGNLAYTVAGVVASYAWSDRKIVVTPETSPIKTTTLLEHLSDPPALVETVINDHKIFVVTMATLLYSVAYAPGILAAGAGSILGCCIRRLSKSAF